MKRMKAAPVVYQLLFGIRSTSRKRDKEIQVAALEKAFAEYKLTQIDEYQSGNNIWGAFKTEKKR